MNWQIRTGPKSVIGATFAAEILLGRLEYIVKNGDRCNQQKLLGEAIEYGRLLVGWLRENQPKVELPVWRNEEHVRGTGSGRPGLMSDG
jgi:hypothetical protein